MEIMSEPERNEEGNIPHDAIIFTEEQLAIRALVDLLGIDK